jgi:hypothetical protein
MCVFAPCHAGCYHLEGIPSLSSGQVTMMLQRCYTVGEAVTDWARRPVRYLVEISSVKYMSSWQPDKEQWIDARGLAYGQVLYRSNIFMLSR